MNWLAATAAAVLLVAGLGTAAALAQQQPAAEPAALTTPAPTVEPAPAPAAPPQEPMSSGVAALVNDDVISTYDLRQRALLFILTSGVPATAENLPQIQQEALRSLIDEHLELQELRRIEKQQKAPFVASDEEVNDAMQELAQDNKLTVPQLADQFSRVGLDLSTLREQIRIQISWGNLIRARFS